MNGHLIPVEVGIKSGTHQGMNPDRFSLHQNGFEGLDPQSMQRGSTIEKDGMLLDHLFQNIPHHGLMVLHHLLGTLDGRYMSFLLQAIVDKGLEQLECHDLGQTALMEFQLRSHYDDGTTRIINALAQQILAKPTLLSFQSIGE